MSQKRKWQFGMWQLMLAVTCIAVLVGIYVNQMSGALLFLLAMVLVELVAGSPALERIIFWLLLIGWLVLVICDLP